MSPADSSSPPAVGLLLTTTAAHPSFSSFCRAARQHLAQGAPVYAYLLHDAVTCSAHPELQQLQSAGLKVHACAAAAISRHLDIPEPVVLSGLGSLAQIISHCSTFHSFSNRS